MNEIVKYKEDNEEDDYFNIGEINNKKLKGFDEDIVDNNIEKEKPTARNIWEKVLNRIEYKIEQLINHNNNRFNEGINNKNENTRKKIFDKEYN